MVASSMSENPSRQVSFHPGFPFLRRNAPPPSEDRLQQLYGRRAHKIRVRNWRGSHRRDVEAEQPAQPSNDDHVESQEPNVSVEPAVSVQPPLSNYWPDIVEAIKKCKWGYVRGIPRSELGIGTAVCAVCNESHLVIDDLQARKPKGELILAGVIQEDGLLTACGHVMGRQCLELWEKHCEDGEQAFTCPCCRFDLDPPRCSAHRLEAITDLSDGELSWIGADGIRPNGHNNSEDAANCSACPDEGQTRRERGLDMYGRQRDAETTGPFQDSPRWERVTASRGLQDPLIG